MCECCKKHLIKIILGALTFLSFWAILAIRFRLPLLIQTSMSDETVAATNEFLITLSYSYIAALVFYLVTNVLSAKQRRDKLEPIIKRKVYDIGRCIHDILLEFHRGTVYGHDVHNTADTEALLKSKDWFSVVQFILENHKIEVTYFEYMRCCGQNIKSQISDLITKYHSEMTAPQLVELENLSKASFFHTIDFVSTLPAIKEIDKASLIDDFIALQNQYMKVEKEFDADR